MNAVRPEKAVNMASSLRARSGMSRLSLALGSLLWVSVFLVLYYKQQMTVPPPVEAGSNPEQAVRDPAFQPTAAGDDEELLVAEPVKASTRTVRLSFPTRQVPEFEFAECLGGTVSREDLAGKRWLANFVFTRCAGPCPLMTRDVSLLHNQVADANPDFMFVTFSVDPKYDTAEVLKKYAETFQADHDRWKFLTGDEQEIHDFVRRAFALYVAPNLGETRRPGYEIAHTNRAVLINEDGIPVGTYLMTVPEDVVKLRRAIDGRDEFPEAGPILEGQASSENPPIQFNLLPVDDSQDEEKAGTSESEATEEPATETSSQRDQQNPVDTTGEDEQVRFRGPLNFSGAGKFLPTSMSADEKISEEVPSAEEEQNTAVDVGTDEGALEETLEAPADATDRTSAASSSSAVSQPETRADRNRRIDQALPAWIGILPALNASLNSCCILLLTFGLMAIRRSEKRQHRNLMISAFALSSVFLISYLGYHEMLYRYTGERGRAFVGSALATGLYYLILVPHVVLAAAVPVLALRVFWLAWKQEWEKHRALARITFPIWMFVSITGVLIYGMLYHWPWSTISPSAGPEGPALQVSIPTLNEVGQA